MDGAASVIQRYSERATAMELQPLPAGVSPMGFRRYATARRDLEAHLSEMDASLFNFGRQAEEALHGAVAEYKQFMVRIASRASSDGSAAAAVAPVSALSPLNSGGQCPACPRVSLRHVGFGIVSCSSSSRHSRSRSKNHSSNRSSSGSSGGGGRHQHNLAWLHQGWSV
eukprot:COSAG01_NODE_482_length_16412_cov_47.760130_7_plen_169_part_00